MQSIKLDYLRKYLNIAPISHSHLPRIQLPILHIVIDTEGKKERKIKTNNAVINESPTSFEWCQISTRQLVIYSENQM